MVSSDTAPPSSWTPSAWALPFGEGQRFTPGVEVGAWVLRHRRLQKMSVVGCMMADVLMNDVVATSGVVSATRSRLAKVDALADLIRRAGDQVRAVVAFLAGTPLQGRIGAGWRTLVNLRSTPADEPSLTVAEVDRTFEDVAVTSGKGSAGRRNELLGAMFGKATKDEQDFLLRLLAGELRQGALEGIMLDAIAKAADVDKETVRRAFMLSGQLPDTAAAAMTGGA